MAGENRCGFIPTLQISEDDVVKELMDLYRQDVVSGRRESFMCKLQSAH